MANNKRQKNYPMPSSIEEAIVNKTTVFSEDTLKTAPLNYRLMTREFNSNLMELEENFSYVKDLKYNTPSYRIFPSWKPITLLSYERLV